jgi:cytochrome c-type protein NapC
MITPGALTVLVFIVSIGLAAALIWRPGLTATHAGKVLAFVCLFLLPLICSGLGVSQQFVRSEQTTFCLSCHIMEPYGRSLHVDDPHYIAAAHFQNHRIPADEACYTCHTDYAMYGGLQAKLRGLRHIYVQYLGTLPKQVHLYSAYNNRECLHCHAGARSFEDDATHSAIRDSLTSNEISCVSSGCHDTVHNVSQLDKVKFWEAPK